MGDIRLNPRRQFAVAACVLILGMTSCSREDAEPVATEPATTVGVALEALDRLPPFTLVSAADEQPVVVETAIGVLQFSTLNFPADHQLYQTVTTPHGLVAADLDEVSLRWSTDGGITWEGTTASIDVWRVTTVDDDVVAYGHDGAVRFGWDGSGWSETARLDLVDGVEQLVFGPHGAVAAHGTTIYRSSDGTHFTEADQSPRKELLGTTGSGGCHGEPGSSSPGDRLGPILATDAGFVALTPGHPGDWTDTPTCQPRLWFSADGNTWQLTPDDSPFGHAAHVNETFGVVAEHGGQFALSGEVNGHEGAVWLSNDGLTWQLADVDPFEPGTIAGGELGWILTSGEGPNTQEMWFSIDGVTWDGPYTLPSGLRSGWLPSLLTVGPGTMFGVGGRDMVPVLVILSEPGTVTVSISGIDDAAGTYLAGVLHQSELTAQNAVGGFGVMVDSDSFATSQVVREPQPDPDYDNTLFPYVSDEPLVVDSDNHYLQLWFAPSELGPYSRLVPADSEGLRGCVMQFSLEPGTAVHVSVTGVPSPGTEVTLTCPAVSWETIPSSEAISSSSRPQEETEWKIALNDEGPGIHTVFIITTFPLREADVQDLGGRLVWEDAEIELCRIGIRSVGDGFVQIGDIFQTTEGCGTNTGMQQVFDDYGLPETACVYVRADGLNDEYCAPLAVD